MNSVGRILRSARERQDRALADIAHELCLTQEYLRAIEEDDVKGLPGVFFYRNFVRQYAAILGVNELEIRAGVEALAVEADETVQPVMKPPTPIRRLDPIVAESNRTFAGAKFGASLAGFVVVLLACSAFYAWWSRPSQAATSKPQPLPPVVQPADAPLPVPTPAASAAEPVLTPAENAPVQVAASAETRTINGINQVVLNLSATEKTWLSITSDGKRLFSGFLEPSQTKTLTGVEAARMTVGNAGGLEVRLNGKPIGPIGKSGQVRVVVFTPDNFEVLPLDPPAPTSETL